MVSTKSPHHSMVLPNEDTPSCRNSRDGNMAAHRLCDGSFLHFDRNDIAAALRYFTSPDKLHVYKPTLLVIDSARRLQLIRNDVSRDITEPETGSVSFNYSVEQNSYMEIPC